MIGAAAEYLSAEWLASRESTGSSLKADRALVAIAVAGPALERDDQALPLHQAAQAEGPSTSRPNPGSARCRAQT
jgi:hypothetical protein